MDLVMTGEGWYIDDEIVLLSKMAI